jgi:hypothetical protein
MNALLRRLPERQEILYAGGGIFFIIYSWALRGFFYQLSSFILFHSVGDILAIFAYMMALALLEALTFLLLLVGLSFTLPPRWLQKGFGGKAFLILLVTGVAAVALESYLTKKLTGLGPLYFGLILALTISVALVFLYERTPPLRRLLSGLLERMQVFTYLYVPLGVLSLLVVLARLLG